MSDFLWYKDAIVYQLHVKAFFDSNGDGFGDFKGLTEKLDYLSDLGVTAVWILPFYPSPLRDDGYDIADYKAIHRAYGTMGDFRRFVREAHERGLKVITELVINHTSDQHAWFQRAREAKPGSKARDMYVWSDTDQRYLDTRIIFTDTETSNWAWDPLAKAYYWHRFFAHQPDLNWDNPRIFEEITRVMKFWLDCGVDGMRLDAIPYLVERDGTNNENLPETHVVLKRLRAWLDAHYEDRMFLAEANQWPEDVREYFGEAGDECHMAFHFPVMPRIYMAVAQEDRHPITDIMRQTPEIPAACQWAIFLRNHDELTLEMVTDRERDYMNTFYANDSRARINVGIRRRLAPLLDNDRRKIELLNSLLMSMPGTPIIYYGDEIGMGDNIFLGDRDGVRTPMQWSPDRNGGFSRADPASLYLPTIMDAVYGFFAVNVEAQSRSPSSLLNWMRRLIAVRKRHPSFGRGTLRFLYPGNRKILAYLREFEGEVILCVANLSRAPQPAELGLAEFSGRVPVEMLGNSVFPPIGELHYFITLPAYGFYWFRLSKGEGPSWHEPPVEPLPDLSTLVLPRIWDSLGSDGPLRQIQGDILPAFLPKQRWFSGKEHSLRGVEMTDHAVISAPGAASGWMLALWRADYKDGAPGQTFQLPLDIAWESREDDPLSRLLPFTLARVRRVNRVGALYDAMAGPAFPLALVQAMAEGANVTTAKGGGLRFTRTQAFPAGPLPGPEAVARLGREQSNTSIKLGEDMVLKLYRRVEAGIHPEIEIGRFLTDVAGFANAPPLLGALEHIDAKGAISALAVLQGFVRNQGDGWDYMLAYLDRFLDDRAQAPAEVGEGGGPAGSPHGIIHAQADILGQRVAELHHAFATPTEDPAFSAEAVGPEDLASWREQVRTQAAQARQALDTALPGLSAEVAGLVTRLLDCWERIDARVDAPISLAEGLVKTRIHGDLHLGQVVVVRDDFHILDFEGEPVKGLSERRDKHCPLKDVAGMLRSFDYAAWSAALSFRQTHAEVRIDVLPALGVWQEEIREAFLAGYDRAIAGCPSVPALEEGRRDLLSLFMLEKALYEVSYEAANRPDWLRIPIGGVLRLLGEGPSDEIKPR
ncbi:maltose alpha-D-glucosyltransferase [Rhodospirillum rubrum]|uniref:Maltokinase n=1 Tax=Rhodospirillum rubrum (strain ATCC 11170 / ATH 1.1.1 / DSM 467 / LMG 4362 / NCIMB 8255 / S1) TaxID=269796 RepID=Q2RTZ0_RHORT|nr:maltose alpha-D-glucosyltransferase [Rhodospirillum rubrum]ABC22405.1 Alpha amylase, catalytic region [Rhodospirillum rubrum ATCC 11170]AEO48122.1 alpha amylase, catalytic region [Rhodospirillum rubrum F11]MBK5953986.1 maltose alpha-D-glucosyltransferase [Rhodospirillum rubrum]QXG82041.1 maltose alpha-D-glucosyltransferase [Rhodospirillum rubrum]HAQ00752.1 maltose alpha-D-glucosyltransferase [Rhodospirillum rubrum]